MVTKTNASQIAYIPAGSGAVITDVQTILKDMVRLTDFAIGDGIADDTTKIESLINDTVTGNWIDGGNKTYLISSTINVTNPVVRIRNARFVLGTSYANQGRFSMDAGSGNTAMTVELENINVDGGRGTYKTGNELWQTFASYNGYYSIQPTLNSIFRVNAYNSGTSVRIKNVNFYNIHADSCVQIGTYGSVFIDNCEYRNISNKTFHVYHSQDDGATQAGSTFVNNVSSIDVGILPAAYTVDGVAKIRADAYAPQGSFNFIVSHGDFLINNAIVRNYGSCGVTADRNRSFAANNISIFHDSLYGFSNNPSGAFWVEACNDASVTNLLIDIKNRDLRDYGLDSSALQVYLKDDQRCFLNNVVIHGNKTAEKLKRAIRCSTKNICQFTIYNFYVDGLYVFDPIKFGQLPDSAIGADIRLKDGAIVLGNVNADVPKMLDIISVKIGGNITINTSGNIGITGSIDDISITRSAFLSFTNSTTITRSLRISNNTSTGALACGSVSGQCIIDSNERINGAISINNSSARIGIHNNLLITSTVIISNANDVKFLGNTTNRRIEVKDVKTFAIVGNTTKTDSAESVIWINPIIAANILAGVISSNNVLIKTGTVGAGYVTIGAGIVGVTDINNNKLTVAWS